ncbi:MAG: type II secretion system GspH family protein [Puniceicoccales bacterium]|jgi:prepilin-type N-terminal cleavage/methylation domain-containing protein|nr:type II secretion system GspH family protein [Puniceicoccales bacterium]
MKICRKRYGYSLIEAVVVMAIIGLMSAMLIPAVTKSNRSIKLTQSRLRIAKIANALKSYYAEYGCWPDALKPNVAYSFIEKTAIFSSMLIGNVNYVSNYQQQDLLYLNPKRLKFMKVVDDDLYRMGTRLQKDKLADGFNNPAIYVIFADPNEDPIKIPPSAFNLYPSIKAVVPEDGLGESVAVFSYAEEKTLHSNVRSDAMDVLSWD